MRRGVRIAATATAVAALVIGAAGCSDDDERGERGGDAVTCVAGEPSPDEFPDVVAAEADETDDGIWTFTVTMTSPYDTPERYADGWRVLGPDCTVYGVHTLTHDHADEQPFTRTQSGVEIPDTVDRVTIEGRDQHNGFGGSVRTITLDRG